MRPVQAGSYFLGDGYLLDPDNLSRTSLAKELWKRLLEEHLDIRIV
jgi:hypothetical protein